MLTRYCLLVCVTAAFTFADAGAEEDSVVSKLVGTWNYASGEKNGEKLDADHFEGQSVEITKKTITLKSQETFVLEYELSTDQKPVTVKMTITEGPFGVGATYRCVNRFMGKEIETEGVISEYAPEKKCSFRFTSGPVTGESSFIFEPSEDGTVFTTVGELDIGLFRLAGFMIRRAARAQIKNDLLRLKAVLENGNGRRPKAKESH